MKKESGGDDCMLVISIRSARINENLSQEQLAERMGVSRQTVYRWESGKKAMSEEEQDRFCKICNCIQKEIKEFKKEG